VAFSQPEVLSLRAGETFNEASRVAFCSRPAGFRPGEHTMTHEHALVEV
jgi:hypothetical protein